MCAEALLVVWSDLREKFVEQLLGNSDCDRDYFGFKAWFLPEQKMQMKMLWSFSFIESPIIYILCFRNATCMKNISSVNS